MQYYDEVERKLTLVTNKIAMTYDDEIARLLNKEVRADDLHVFISSLKKSLRAVVFPAQPKDLPAALALAREAEASNERSMFAATRANTVRLKNKAKILVLTATQKKTPIISKIQTRIKIPVHGANIMTGSLIHTNKINPQNIPRTFGREVINKLLKDQTLLREILAKGARGFLRLNKPPKRRKRMIMKTRLQPLLMRLTTTVTTRSPMTLLIF